MKRKRNFRFEQEKKIFYLWWNFVTFVYPKDEDPEELALMKQEVEDIWNSWSCDLADDQRGVVEMNSDEDDQHQR